MTFQSAVNRVCVAWIVLLWDLHEQISFCCYKNTVIEPGTHVYTIFITGVLEWTEFLTWFNE